MLGGLRSYIEGRSARERKLLIALGIIILVALFYFFILQNQIKDFNRVSKELEEGRANLVKLRQKAENLSSLQGEEKASREKLEELASHFDRDFQDGAALVMLGMKCLEHQVSVVKVQPGGLFINKESSKKTSKDSKEPLPIIDKGNYLEIPVGIELRGPYQPLMAIIDYLEKNHNLAEIRTLELIRPEEGGHEEDFYINGRWEKDQWVEEEVLLTAKFDLVFYSNKLPEQKLQLELDKMSQWIQDRSNEPFINPGNVSPLPEIPRGGELQYHPIVQDMLEERSEITNTDPNMEISEPTSENSEE